VISLPDLLRRFRRTWAPPGPAQARVAPPVDITARLRAEIQPLLDALTDVQREAKIIRRDAENSATASLDKASQEAVEQVREAERQAPSVRSAAAEQQGRAVDADISSTLAAGRREAERIEQQARQRLPELLESVRTCVLKGVSQ
jgi:vacuolar-type H+-ATPase subunit H